MNTDRAKQAEYNLAVLKRRDTQIDSILGSAGHVVLYQFNEENKAWDRKNVEGSLFVVKRAVAPQHQFVVLNRLSSDNLVETIDENFQTELTEQFLLYRNSSSEILGVWFYSPPERASIADLLTSLTSTSQSGLLNDDGGRGSVSEREPPPSDVAAGATEQDQQNAPGSSNNVAQFFNMMAGTQQAPPPMPVRAVSAAEVSDVVDAALPSTTAASGVTTSPSAAIGSAASSGRPPVDMAALKAKLAGQLRSLLDDDAFMSLLANEYLRQQQRAFQQAQQARQQRGGRSSDAAPANPEVPTHLAGLQQQATM